MNRNVESHFAELPSVDIQRSIFDRSSNHKTAFNVGDLIPFYVDEVLPGDTFNVTTSKVVRLPTLLDPVMDNLYLDTYFFFVRFRDCWIHGKQFFGENTESAWIPETIYQVPSISSPPGGFDVGTIADYFGLPVGVEWDNTAVNRPSALPFRAYALICDQWFRDENVTDPLNIPLGDSNQSGTNGGSYINDVANGGKPFRVSRYHNYFSSALPSPQKGPSVDIGLLGDDIPVYAGTPFGDDELIWKNKYNHQLHTKDYPHSQNTYYLGVSSYSGSAGRTYVVGTETATLGDTSTHFTPDNLYADISTAASVSINELRLAFQLQKYYERLARGGSRYTEILQSFFGVYNPDAVLQRTEYLGGNRIPIQIHEVTNTAQSEQDFLGDLGAMSVTSDIHEDFVHSFTEHGYVIGVCCLRYDNTFSQGLEKFWTRRTREQFYWPTFANLGEMPIDKSELYADATTMASQETFGYQEAWADYRYKPDRCSATMRPGVKDTLSSWHFGDYYNEAPTLSDSWMRVDKTNVDRALAVTSEVTFQCFADIYVKNICTRPMPMYSIPGLIDHH